MYLEAEDNFEIIDHCFHTTAESTNVAGIGLIQEEKEITERSEE